MINSQEYIDSGILELYVYGKLNEDEAAEVQKMAQHYEEINQEIIAIEQALILVSGSVAPALSVKNYETIKNHIFIPKSEEVKKELVQKMPAKSTNDPFTMTLIYTGWITVIIVLLVSFYYYDLLEKESKLKQNTLELEKNDLNNKLLKLQLKNDEAEHLISVFRDTSNIVVPLQGQDAAPKAFAKIYWNKKNKTIYIDALGLPSPPFGMVYQVWAFKLNPLTPTNLGVMDSYQKEGRKFFKVNPLGEIDAFGISLEPEGGNETPTLEQLFALGKV